MSKRILKKWLLPCILTVFSVFAVSCGEETAKQSETVTLTLEYESVTVGVFEEISVAADYNGKETLEWVSDNAQVAVVQNGVIGGVSEGTAVITVKDGERSDSLTVYVTGLEEDSLGISVEKTSLSLYVADGYELNPSVTYKGKEMNEASFSYSSGNEEIATVSSDGKIVAKAVGKTAIDLSAEFQGKTKGIVVNVEVCPVGEILISQDVVTLDACLLASDHVVSEKITATAYEKGEEISSAELVWKAATEQDVFNVSADGTVTALNAGTAELEVSFVGSDGYTVTSSVNVIVNAVEKIVDQKISVNMADGYEVDESFFEDETAAIVGAALSNGTLSIPLTANGKQISFDNATLFGEKTLLIQTRNIIYRLSAELWSAVITNADELKTLYSANLGWYKLGGDIDMNGVEWNPSENTVFGGLFDGAGYTIENLKVDSYGLFAKVGTGATVKNLVLKNAAITENANGTGLLFGRTTGSNSIITLENVSIQAINRGTACGAIVGYVNTGNTLNIKDFSAFVYCSDGGEKTGSVAGCVGGALNFENTVVYSGATLVSAYADSLNTQAEDINANDEVTSRPEKYGEKVNIYDVEESGVTLTFDDLTNVKLVKVYGANYREADYSNGELLLTTGDVEGFSGGYLDLLFEKNDGTTKYYTVPLSAILKLTQDNLEKLLQISGTEDIILTQNVDASSIKSWISTVVFCGNFDGQGYTIDNLRVSASANANSGLFKSIGDGATVKNLALTNVVISGSCAGALAYSIDGSNTIENVFITIKSASGNWIGGIADRRNYTSGVAVTSMIKNVVVAMTENTNQRIGLGFGYAVHPNTILTDCYFIGGTGRIVSELNAKDSTTGNSASNVFVSSDLATATENFLAALDAADTTIALTEFLQAKANDVWRAKEISQANVGDLLTLSGSEFLVLTEDIDIGAYLTSKGLTEWESTVVFGGVFDGQGHSIKNMAASYGLFKALDGATIKNVAIVNASITNKDNTASGTIAAQANGSNVLDNIFIEVNLGSAAWKGGVVDRVGYVNGVSGAIKMTNAVVAVTSTASEWLTRQGLFAGNQSRNATLENCYFVSNELSDYVSSKAATNQSWSAKDCAIYNADGDTTAEAAFLAAVNASASTVRLTDFLRTTVNAVFVTE